MDGRETKGGGVKAVWETAGLAVIITINTQYGIQQIKQETLILIAVAQVNHGVSIRGCTGV